MCPIRVWRSERPDANVAAIARTHTSTDMARGSAWHASGDRGGDLYDEREGPPGCRQAVDIRRASVTAYDDDLFPHGKEHGDGCDGISRRRLTDPGHRPGGHGGLRLANVQGHHVRAAEVPRAAYGSVVEPVVRLLPRHEIVDGVGGCAEDSGTGALSCRGVAYRSAQDRSARVLGRRPYGGSDEHAF